MTPDLIALVLSQSLPVRLALLDAEPNGIGCFVPVVASEPGNCYVAMRVTPYERKRVQDGAVWLPANPLVIAASAVKAYGRGRLEIMLADDGVWCFDIMDGDKQGPFSMYATHGKCPHTAAIALLREVVG